MSDLDRFMIHGAAGALAIATLKAGRFPDQAAAMHAHAGKLLEDAGFEVTFEAGVGHIGDYRRGRIDLFATLDGGAVAIELDCRTPRRRSVHKLRLIDAYRLVCLRGIEMDDPPAGIDAVIALRVRKATKAELLDKRTVNRLERAA